MPVSYVFAGLALADFPSSRGWYEQLLGRPPDRLPNDNEAVWQLTETGLIYVVADPGRAGHALLALAVDNLDDHLAQLGARGISPGPIETAEGLFRKARVTDPDGNVITLFEAPPQPAAG